MHIFLTKKMGSSDLKATKKGNILNFLSNLTLSKYCISIALYRKFNKTHFIQGNDFTNLIDFGHAKDVTIEEPIQEPRERGKSFALPGE